MILCCTKWDLCKTSGLFPFFQYFKYDALCVFQALYVSHVIPCPQTEKTGGNYDAEYGKFFGVHCVN